MLSILPARPHSCKPLLRLLNCMASERTLTDCSKPSDAAISDDSCRPLCDLAAVEAQKPTALTYTPLPAAGLLALCAMRLIDPSVSPISSSHQRSYFIRR